MISELLQQSSMVLYSLSQRHAGTHNLIMGCIGTSGDPPSIYQMGRCQGKTDPFLIIIHISKGSAIYD